ncbi:hypothetical protein COE20_28745 [Bacillus cereus]|uniref:hypothetical protein n=1 Tax=Bacillus cereus TaxID=1396 RepID=UPI000BF52B3E|nr:hypothetical protein [Bacillus cereus]PFN14418.1 hypothetical protein COJ72_16645 [Bacillus cereus]PGY21058.1 hypothetical protein COE20_28745 [Bacillus cereus]
MLENVVLGYKQFFEKEIPNKEILALVNEKLESNLNELPYLWSPIIYQYIFEDEKIYWDRKIMNVTYERMQEIYFLNKEPQQFITVLAEALEYFFVAFSAFNDIVKNIKLNKELGGPPQIEFRMFYIPVYNSLVEGCWTNLLKFWRNLLNLVDVKDLLPQNKLNSLVELVNGRGLGSLTKDIDVDIRNAINHGGIHIIDDQTAIFQYSKGKNGIKTKQIKLYKFKRTISNLIDLASGTFVGILKFLSEERFDFKGLSPYIENEFVYDSLVKLEISSYFKSCVYIYKSQTMDTKSNQLNLSFYTDEMSIDEKLNFSIFTFLKLYLYYPEIDRFFISFKSERCLSSFIIADSCDLKMFYTGELESLDILAEKVIQKNTPLLYDPYLEAIDINEAKKKFYSNIKTEKYEVVNIKDISMEDRKRFRATIYVEGAYRKNHIKQIVNEVIHKIKKLKNAPDLKHKIKFGEMPADLVHLTVYQVRARDGRREKHQISSNTNFIATVQYFSDKKYMLPHSGLKDKIWEDLKFRTEGNIEYGWNPNFGND